VAAEVAERLKTVDHTRAERAQDDPANVEQPNRRGVKKKVNHFRF
jgi:hypothetical protein